MNKIGHRLSVPDIRQTRERLGEGILTTPVWQCRSPLLSNLFGNSNTQVWLKLELWQYGGSFKARGALTGMLALTDQQKQRGIVAISAGNHAIGVAYAAQYLHIPAKVFMPKTASPVRMARCKYFGATVELSENIQDLFKQADAIARNEQRVLIHPFNGVNVTLGTGTLGVELYDQLQNLDAIIVPVGGGGLISGIANAYKQLQPSIKIYGVEPEGAAVMTQSLKAGKPVEVLNLHTIADSLATPCTAEYPFSLCQELVDQIVTVSDHEIIQAMRFLFNEMKLAVEPAAATGIAALLGPLRNTLTGKRIAIIISGTNIDEQKYCTQIIS